MWRNSRHSAAASLFSCLLLLSQLGFLAAQGALNEPAAVSTCPLKSEDFAKTDFSTVRTACDVSAMAEVAFCKSCVCGLGTAIVLGFQQAGVKINGQPVTEVAEAGDINSLNTLLNNCSAEMGIELLQAGALSAEALQQLTQCDVSENSLQCAEEDAAGAATTPGQPASSGSPAAPGTETSQGVGQSQASQPTAAASTATSAAVGRGHNMNAVATVGLFVAAIMLLL